MLEMFAKKRGFQHVEDTKLDAYMFLRGKTACPRTAKRQHRFSGRSFFLPSTEVQMPGESVPPIHRLLLCL